MKKIPIILLLLAAVSCQEKELESGSSKERVNHLENNIHFIDQTLYDNFSPVEYEPTRDAVYAAEAISHQFLTQGNFDAPGYEVLFTGSGEELTLVLQQGTYHPWTENNFIINKAGKEIVSGDIYLNINGKDKTLEYNHDGSATFKGKILFGKQSIEIEESSIKMERHLIRTDFELSLKCKTCFEETLLTTLELSGNGDATSKIPIPEKMKLIQDIPGKLTLRANVNNILKNDYAIGAYYNGNAEKRVDFQFTNLRRTIVLSLLPDLAKWLEDEENPESIGALSLSDELFFFSYPLEITITPERFPLTAALLEGRAPGSNNP